MYSRSYHVYYCEIFNIPLFSYEDEDLGRFLNLHEGIFNDAPNFLEFIICKCLHWSQIVQILYYSISSKCTLSLPPENIRWCFQGIEKGYIGNKWVNQQRRIESLNSEAVVPRCSVKKRVLKKFRKIQKTFLQHRSFPVNFAKSFKTPFFIELFMIGIMILIDLFIFELSCQNSD